MALSNYEKETVIVFNDAEDTATFYTCNQSWKTKLNKLIEQTAEVKLKCSDEDSCTYILPKSYVKVKPPKQLSEEQKEALRDRMRNVREAKKVL